MGRQHQTVWEQQQTAGRSATQAATAAGHAGRPLPPHLVLSSAGLGIPLRAPRRPGAGQRFQEQRPSGGGAAAAGARRASAGVRRHFATCAVHDPALLAHLGIAVSQLSRRLGGLEVAGLALLQSSGWGGMGRGAGTGTRGSNDCGSCGWHSWRRPRGLAPQWCEHAAECSGLPPATGGGRAAATHPWRRRRQSKEELGGALATATPLDHTAPARAPRRASCTGRRLPGWGCRVAVGARESAGGWPR